MIKIAIFYQKESKLLDDIRKECKFRPTGVNISFETV